MSLINDALKKAQKLQTQQPAASAPSPVPAGTRPAQMRAVPRRGQPAGFERILLGVGALALLLVGGTVGTVLLLRKGETPVVATAPHPAAADAAATPAPAASAPVTSVAPPMIPPPAAAATVSISPARTAASPVPPPITAGAPLPDSAPPTPSPQPAVSVEDNPAPAPAMAEAPLPAQVSNPTPPATEPVVSRQPAAPKQDYKILSFIDKLKVLGIRAAGSDSKVLMSGRVYRLNDIVDYELGLRLTGVGTTMLTFLDENGVVYTKSL
jgi:hypothetical protein